MRDALATHELFFREVTKAIAGVDCVLAFCSTGPTKRAAVAVGSLVGVRAQQRPQAQVFALAMPIVNSEHRRKFRPGV
eukprot:SAG31_NODE_933_length_10897_cov_15.489442_12_plen_78_part_00